MRRNSNWMRRFPKTYSEHSRTARPFWRSIGFRESIITQLRKTKPTVREYPKQTRYTGSGHAGFVGTPEQLADHIEDWFYAGAIDGFNLQPDRRFDRLDVIVDELVLILRKRGLYRYGYETRTLREHFRASAPAAPCKNRWTQMGCPVLLRGAPKLGAAKKGRGQEASELKRDPERKARRWVVEVAHSWFNRFRKLLVRYEKLDRF